jgi:two-component system NtrC family response regulator
MNREKILIVDDEESIRSQLKWGLEDQYEVVTAATAEEARRALRDERPRVVTLDIALSRTGGEEGLALLDEIVDLYPLTRVVMVTGNESRENALLAIRRGAVDWYAKPIQLDELRGILSRAFHVQQIEEEQAAGVPPGRKRYHRLIGDSEPMQKVFSLIQRVAPTDATVLVLGENGTGKELVAHAIHQASRRREGAFVPINCGAIPEALLESELFGHERGAFTDAHRTREGKFEIADGGTIFLDEIGELPVHLQVKLLRFLQDHVIERVGGRDPIKVDVRVVAATNRDLKAAIAGGRFREDLFYRLSVVAIQIPPLRERGDDVRVLAEYFLDFYARHHKRRLKGFTQSSLRAIQAHPWPGNVRELENRIRRAVLVGAKEQVGPDELDLPGGAAPASAAARAVPEGSVGDEATERRLIEEALLRADGMVSRAAEELGLSRQALYRKMSRLGIVLERRPRA